MSQLYCADKMHQARTVPICHEDSFGPVKLLVCVRGLETTVTCAHDNLFGLTAAGFGGGLGLAF